MYRLHGFYTQNTMKALYVIEELGLVYEYKQVDLMKRENKSEEFLKLNPFGKTPTLQHDDDSLFESGAICRYLANVENSELYPKDKMQRAKVDQWMDFFSSHLGRWMNTLFFENVIKQKANLGAPDTKTCEESKKFAEDQLVIVDAHLGSSDYFVGGDLTIADLFAFAYLEQAKPLNFSLDEYPNVRKWLAKIESKDSIKKARQKASPQNNS